MVIFTGVNEKKNNLDLRHPSMANTQGFHHVNTEKGMKIIAIAI